MMTDILFVTPSYPPKIGGVERHVARVAQELAKLGHSVSVFTVNEHHQQAALGSPMEPSLYSIVVPPARPYLPFRMIRIIRIWRRLIRLYAEEFSAMDVIHLHDVSSFIWFIPCMLIYRKRPFITYHGYSSIRISFWMKAGRKLSEKSAAGNICVGAYLSRWYGTIPTKVVLGGVDEQPDYRNDPEEKAVFIGRLANDTGFIDYLNCLSELMQKQRLTLRLEVCGGGPLLGSAMTLAKSKNLKIVFHGLKPDPSRILSQCSLLFAAGYLSILEAMMHRKLVFALYQNELRRDYFLSIPNGEDLLIMRGSVQELAEEIEQFIRYPSRYSQRLQAAFGFARNHSWSSVAQTYVRLYQAAS